MTPVEKAGMALGLTIIAAALLFIVVLAAILFRSLMDGSSAVVLFLFVVVLGGAWALVDERKYERDYRESTDVRDPE